MSNSYRPTRREKPQLLRAGVMLLVCFLATTELVSARAESRAAVRSAAFALDVTQDVYDLEAKVDLVLPEDARKGIEAGLTLRLTYQIELYRVRNYLPDAGVAQLEQPYELSYHALSQRYLVRNLNTGEQQDFGTLQAALEELGDVRGLPVIDADLVEKGPAYEGRLRAVLDLSTTPDALSWLLFWSDDWSATSEWYAWPLRP
jgi:hypothetical protein